MAIAKSMVVNKTEEARKNFIAEILGQLEPEIDTALTEHYDKDPKFPKTVRISKDWVAMKVNADILQSLNLKIEDIFNAIRTRYTGEEFGWDMDMDSDNQFIIFS